MSTVTTNQPGYYGQGSLEVSSSVGSGEGPVRRLAITKDKFIHQPMEGVDTVSDIVSFAVRMHGNKNALGWRDIVRVTEEDKEVIKVIDGKEVVEKKKWKYFELSDYKYMSYIDVQTAILEVSRGLIKYGIAKGDVFNVYAQTSVNWRLISHGCTTVAITIATAYDTLGEEGLTHSLNEPECVGVFTNAELLPTLLRVLPNTPTVKLIVFDGEPKQKLLEDLRAVRNTATVVSIDELRAIGRSESTDSLTERAPKKEDVALIMYTSGSTGNPKGVVITHANLVASVGAVSVLLGHHLTKEDTYLAYLPLAHVIEFIVELIMFFVGTPVGYGRVKTLTDVSVRNCKGDIYTFRPSIMVGVPAVWETIRKSLLTTVDAGGSLTRNLFHGAVYVKKHNIPVLSQLADKFVLSRVRAATGGRLRVALCGGAAISRETQEFLSTVLVTLVQGYGLTESCGMCAILPPELHQYGVVGLPAPSIEIKLLDVPDAGYFAKGTPQQGEVCLRGLSVTSGYYKRPDLNSDETIFTKDGWFRTGDIGQWNPDGTLALIDRLKNLIKLETGEYIALERLEAIYKSCNLVGNLCVHATQDAKQPIAIVIPHPQHLQNYLSSKGINTQRELAALCEDPVVKDIMKQECNSIGKRNGFKPFELLQAVILTPDEWTPENGLVTAAQKVQRAKIAKTFRAQIDEAYKKE